MPWVQEEANVAAFMRLTCALHIGRRGDKGGLWVPSIVIGIFIRPGYLRRDASPLLFVAGVINCQRWRCRDMI
jgi:hypothetical protein